jgi:hypothetical protein
MEGPVRRPGDHEVRVHGRRIPEGEKLHPRVCGFLREDDIAGDGVAPDIDLVAIETELRGEANGLTAAVVEQFGDFAGHTISIDLFVYIDKARTIRAYDPRVLAPDLYW